MINFDDVIKENIKKQNPHWPEIPCQPCNMSINMKQIHCLI